MVGLAGNPVDEMALFGTSSNAGLNDSPNGMANDLTSLFEAARGYSGMLSNGYEAATNGDSGFGQQDELSRILRDLF